MEIPEDLIHANFFFVDIIGLSDPFLSTESQRNKISILYDCIKKCDAFQKTPLDEKLILPTGDGVAIGFLHGIENPLKLAIELQQRLKKYNENVIYTEKIFLRIGCNAGEVFLVRDVADKVNLWGPGIIMARRVMDIGDSDHILLTSDMAESLFSLDDEYKKTVHPLHDYEIKHGKIILLYNAYGDNFGNDSKPNKGLTDESKLESFQAANNFVHYSKASFNFKINDLKTHLVHHKQSFDIVNTSQNEPLFEILHSIHTDVEKNFHEIDVKSFDDKKNELKITSINVDTPFEKEFLIRMKSPIFINDVDGGYEINYVSEEPKRSISNVLLFDSDSLFVSLCFPSFSELINPDLSIILENKSTIKIEPDSILRKGLHTTVTWKYDSVMSSGCCVFLEW